jgi:hypothetical protein
MNNRILAAAAALVLSAGAQAATVYSDNFDGNTPASNLTPAGWSISGGSVDIVGPGYFDMLPGNGGYVDLDGSTGSAGLLFTNVVGSASGTYTVTFDLAGNQRGSTESVLVTFGTTTQTFTLNSSDPFAAYSLTTSASSGPLLLSFQDVNSHDNIGALLDNVSVSSVPEPAMGSLLLAGLGALGFAARRRRAGKA